MAEISDADALGVGIEFERMWDFEISTSHSLSTVRGMDVMMRDIAFAVSRDLGDVLDTLATEADLEEARSDVRDLLLADDRIQRVLSLEMSRDTTEPYARVTISFDVVIQTGEVAEGVVEV